MQLGRRWWSLFGLAVGLSAGLTSSAEPVADYPWTHEIRPTIRCAKDFVTMYACEARGGVIKEETVDLEPLDPKRRLEFGERYDPEQFRRCKDVKFPPNPWCDVYRLRRIELPVHFPYPDVPLPDLPPAVSDGGYVPGMTAEEYFDHLCRTEAGKFIYDTVEGVEGIFQMRPRPFASDLELKDRYVMPAPYGYSIAEGTNWAPGFFVGPHIGYSHFESTLWEPGYPSRSQRNVHPTMLSTPSAHDRYIRYTGNGDRKRDGDIRKQYAINLRSNYGYFWRDIRRTMDRELGLGGGEIIVVELKTNRVLAIWRGFVYTGRGRIWWLGGFPCPSTTSHTNSTVDFLKTVLVPEEWSDR